MRSFLVPLVWSATKYALQEGRRCEPHIARWAPNHLNISILTKLRNHQILPRHGDIRILFATKKPFNSFELNWLFFPNSSLSHTLFCSKSCAVRVFQEAFCRVFEDTFDPKISALAMKSDVMVLGLKLQNRQFGWSKFAVPKKSAVWVCNICIWESDWI